MAWPQKTTTLAAMQKSMGWWGTPTDTSLLQFLIYSEGMFRKRVRELVGARIQGSWPLTILSRNGCTGGMGAMAMPVGALMQKEGVSTQSHSCKKNLEQETSDCWEKEK